MPRPEMDLWKPRHIGGVIIQRREFEAGVTQHTC